ncbi:Golgi apyrase [Coemansia sp. RSA 988]|nr:Golgi apyrase [Coemansia sp. RSA 988]
MIYAWDSLESQQSALSSNHSNRLRLPLVERAGEKWTFKTSPGISSFANSAESVGVQHIKPLLDFAQTTVPQQQIAQTPVLLLATAGMRLLEPSQQQLLLKTACSYARTNYGFSLPDCSNSFQVVSGELEGLYGWVAVNYLLDGFGSQRSNRQPLSHGFLDMGGASAQIAFEPAAVQPQYRDDLARVTLRSLDGEDHSFDVFVATFLGHGTNEARRRFVDHLKLTAKEDAASAVPSIEDPCLPIGLMLPTTDGSAVLRGGGRFSECVAATEPLLNLTTCPIEPCLLAGVPAPKIDFALQRFVGVSEYWYASHDYLGLGGLWDVERFERQATRFCRRPWTELQRLLSPSADENAVRAGRLQMQCFKAAWLVNVLHKGFRVPRGLSSNFESVNRVGDIELSWTLGALLMLRVLHTIAPNKTSLRAASNPGIVLSARQSAVMQTAKHVELVDDSLWSPLRVVGASRLLVLWSLQPVHVRVIIAAALAASVALACGLLLWVYVRRSSRKSRDGVSKLRRRPTAPLPLSLHINEDIQMDALEMSDSLSAQYVRGAIINGSSMPPKKSPSVTVLDMLARPFQSATPAIEVLHTPGVPSTNTDLVEDGGRTDSMSPNTGERGISRTAALALESSPISRSSSFNSLPLLNRRRGNLNSN